MWIMRNGETFVYWMKKNESLRNVISIDYIDNVTVTNCCRAADKQNF